jgi:hypothetical protein
MQPKTAVFHGSEFGHTGHSAFCSMPAPTAQKDFKLLKQRNEKRRKVKKVTQYRRKAKKLFSGEEMC